MSTKRTYQPSKKKRAKMNSFLKRSARVLRLRRGKGRWKLTSC